MIFKEPDGEIDTRSGALRCAVRLCRTSNPTEKEHVNCGWKRTIPCKASIHDFISYEHRRKKTRAITVYWTVRMVRKSTRKANGKAFSLLDFHPDSKVPTQGYTGKLHSISRSSATLLAILK
jgi:hypothetical protein